MASSRSSHSRFVGRAHGLRGARGPALLRIPVFLKKKGGHSRNRARRAPRAAWILRFTSFMGGAGNAPFALSRNRARRAPRAAWILRFTSFMGGAENAPFALWDRRRPRACPTIHAEFPAVGKLSGIGLSARGGPLGRPDLDTAPNLC